MSFKIGSTVGSYEIVEKLGRGGMATVYKAHHTRLDRYVAIKVLHPMLNEDDSFIRRFNREAQVVAKLEHPNIVPVYDFAEHEGQPYLVMRFVPGDTLKERLSQGSLSRDEITRIAQSIASGLDYAHGKGVLHRDIKPSNIMLASGSGVFITDYGLARMAQAGESTMSQDMLMGTPQYISPEQARGDMHLDGRTDLYSFGVILYEMVTGSPPFQADTSYSIIHMQIFDPPPPPKTLNKNISDSMEAVLLRALAKEPADRYETAGELVAAFTQALDDMPTVFAPAGAAVLPDYTPMAVTQVRAEPEAIDELTPAPEPAPEPETETAVPPPPKRRPTWQLLAGIALLVILCAGLAYGASRIRQARSGEQMPAQAGNPDPAPIAEPAPEEPAPEENVSDNLPEPPPESPPQDRPLFLPPPEDVRPPEALEAELAGNPGDPQLQAELALSYWQNGRSEEARALIGDLFRRVRQPGQFLLVGERLLEAEQFEFAGVILQEGLSRFPDNHQLQHMLLFAFLQAQVEPPIIEQYIGFLQENLRPETEFNMQLAEAYLLYQDGKETQALRNLERLVEPGENPYRATTFYLIGLLHGEMGDPIAAQDAFAQALRHEPPPWLTAQIEKQLQS